MYGLEPECHIRSIKVDVGCSELAIIYNVKIERDAEDAGAWNVSVPDIDGCFTCAYDYEEAKRRAKEAIEGMLESFVAHGEPIPEPTSKGPDLISVTVDFPQIPKPKSA